MSREFGSFQNGYFHDKVQSAFEDAQEGRYEITRHWAKVLKAVDEVASAISSAEASDSRQSYPIEVSINSLPMLVEALAELKRYLQPFIEVQHHAIEQNLKESK